MPASVGQSDPVQCFYYTAAKMLSQVSMTICKVHKVIKTHSLTKTIQKLHKQIKLEASIFHLLKEQ